MDLAFDRLAVHLDLPIGAWSHTFTSVLPASLGTLATAFRQRGYQTAGISANFVLVSKARGSARASTASSS